jgi:hypothetical protein
MIAGKPSPKRPGGADTAVLAVEPDEGLDSALEAARLLQGLAIRLGHRLKIGVRPLEGG